jgi:polar amino acid transport system substrate-binding protein
MSLPRLIAACIGLAMTIPMASAADLPPLRTAVDGTFPPQAFTGLDGKLQGFQIDMGNQLAAHLHRGITIDSANFSGLIPAMDARRYDFLLAPVTANPERAGNMLFTEGYLYVTLQFGIKKGSKPMTSLDDLKGKIVAVNKGSNYDGWAQDNAKKYGFTPLVLDTFTDGVLAVVQGRAYTELGGNTTILYASTQNKQFVGDYVIPGTRAQWSLAIRKDNVAMRNMLEEGLECMKLDGSLAKISEKWYGVAPAKDDAENTVMPGYGVPGLVGYDPTPHTPHCN